MGDILAFLASDAVDARDAHDKLVAEGLKSVSDLRLLTDTDLKELQIAIVREPSCP